MAENFVLRGLGKVDVKGSTVPVGVFALEGSSGGHSTPGRRRPGSARLVGRDSELATLASALAAAQDGRAQVVGIVGEAGAGKSRLCEEIARRAGDLGVIVRHTAGVSHAQSVPLLPIVGLLQNYFGVTPDDDPAEIRRKAGERLLSLDADLDSELGLIFDFLEVPDPARPAPQLGPEARRRRVLEVLGRATHKRSEAATLILILEDLHWFDPHSVAFLEAWIPTFPGTRTLVITNFRPEFHAPWMGHSFYRQLPLAPLDDPAVGELLGELLGPGTGMAALTDQLLPRAGGNPFFAEEIVRGLADEGTLTGEPGAYALARPASEVRVPATVQAVLSARMDRLPGQDKHVLQAAAVIGRTFTDSLLAAVLDSDANSLAEALQALRAAELLQSTGDSGEYRFWHPLTQEVAYGTLLGATRRRLHQCVAAALVATDPGRHDENAALVATHFDAAGDDLEAARWQLRAATRDSLSDWGESARRLRSAIDHLGAVAPSTDSQTLWVKAHALLLRASGFMGSEPAEQDRLLAEARAGAAQLDDPVLFAWLAMSDGSARYMGGDIASAVASFVHAEHLAEVAGDRGLHAWTLCAIGIGNAYTGPLDSGLATARRGIALCAADPAGRLEQTGYSVHDFGHWILSMLVIAAGPLDQARSTLDKAGALYELRPVADWRSWILARHAHLAECTGEPADIERAARAADEAIRLARDAGSAATLVGVLEGVGIAAVLSGRSAAGLETFTEAIQTLRTHRAGAMEEASLLAHMARAHLSLGDAPAARAAAEEAVTVARRQGLRQSATGTGDLVEARSALEAGEALAAETGADTYAAFLAEERARLEPDPDAILAGLKLATDGYTAIGATGHARRLRHELANR